VTDKNGKKIGAAQQMAERRLDNVKGQLTLLKSSFEGLAIKMFGPLMEPFQGVIETLKTGLNTVLEAYTDLSKAMTSQDIEAAEKKYGKTAVAIATGLGQAVTWLKEAFTSVIDKVREFSQMFKESVGEDGLTKFVKIAVIAGVVAGAVAPLLMSFIMLKFLIGGIVSLFAGAGTVLAAAFWPVVLVLGAIGLAYSFLRKENETLLETATRVFGGIKAWVVDVYQNAVLPFIEGIRSFWVPVIEDLGRSWNFVITSIKTLFSELFESFSSVAGGISVNWKMVGQIFMAVFSSILKIAMFVIEGLVRGFKILMFPIRIVLQAVKNIATGFAAMFSGNILEGFKRMGLGLLDFVLSPLRWILKGVGELAEFLGFGQAAKDLATFVEKGSTAIHFPEPTEAGVKVAPKKPTAPGAAGTTAAKKATSDVAKKAKEGMSKDDLKNAVKDGVKEGQEDGPCVEANVNTAVSIDGEAVAKATGKSQARVKERSGGKVTPWQYRQILENGSTGV